MGEGAVVGRTTGHSADATLELPRDSVGAAVANPPTWVPNAVLFFACGLAQLSVGPSGVLTMRASPFLSLVIAIALTECSPTGHLPENAPRSVQFGPITAADAVGCYQFDRDPGQRPRGMIGPMSLPMPYEPPRSFRLTSDVLAEEPAQYRRAEGLSADSHGVRPVGWSTWSREQLVVSWYTHSFVLRRHADGIVLTSVNGTTRVVRRVPCPEA